MSRQVQYADMPYGKEPIKSLYVCQRLLTTLLLVPYWAFYYTLIGKKPRPSWGLRQIINVKFTRRVYKVAEVAGVTWSTRDPTTEPADKHLLKETRFEWVEPLKEELQTGIVKHDATHPNRVGVFIWPKTPPPPQERPELIGIFFHGGGYCHMSAHETSRTSNIPRRLMKDKSFDEIYAVEYRLLQYAPFPAAIQDAAAAYAHLVTHKPQAKIVLIGDSSGGNLALAVARWIRDEAKLAPPAGLLLLSPSCDPSHALPETASAYIPRPHAHTDYLTDTPEPRAQLQRRFLGFGIPSSDEELHKMMEIVHSEYISPVSPRVLKRWNHTVEHDPLEQQQPAADAPNLQLGTLFGGFSKTLVVVGDAERLEIEVKSLVTAMERDGVDVQAVWVPDAVHDVLMMAPGWWDDKVRDRVWKQIAQWLETV